MRALTSLTNASFDIKDSSRTLFTYKDHIILYFSMGRFDLEAHHTILMCTYLPSKCDETIFRSAGAFGGLGSARTKKIKNYDCRKNGSTM